MLLQQNVGGVYNASVSRQLQVAAIDQATPSVVNHAPTVTLPALSLAADSEQLSSAVARLLISPLIHHVGDGAATTTTALAIDGVRQRRRRPVDRSASEPLSASSTVLETGALYRYKTELCRPYEENGTCKYGDKCQFAHGRAELRPVARHPKYKTDLCKTYHTTGLCPYGPRCHFIHNDDERRLNELNRIVVEQQRALLIQRQQKQVLVRTALALARRRQLADAVAARVGCHVVDGHGSTVCRSPSPPSSKLGDEPLTTTPARVECGDEADWTAESTVAALAALGRRVRQAVPQITDAEVDAVVTRLLVDTVLSDSNASSGNYHHRHPYHVQFCHLQQQPHQQTTVAQSSLNSDERLLAL